jgi:serine/threonine protein kinase/predicted Zn-dependent protease
MELLVPKKFCETCGSSVDFDMPSGFCPGCLLNTVLETESESAAGSRIDDYEILSEVARGGMGIVYRAKQRVPSRVVALKMILPAHVGSLGAVNRFRAEAEVAASLDHDAILPIYAVGEHDGAPFYSMKVAEGGTLSARIVDYRDKPREAAALITKLARAVAYAHKQGILHRDLKPGNVLFDAAGKPYVSDFGLAKWLQRECDLTQTLAILGTPYYIAPEQARNSKAVTAAADIYSLGAILYHLLEGRPPAEGDSPMEVLQRANSQVLRLTNRRVPRDLATICLKCLEREPTARYGSAAALAEDLERFCADRPIIARPIGLTSRAWRWSRRNPVLAGLSATTLLLLTTILTLVARHREPTPALPEKSIAVLPFTSFGANQEDAYMTDAVQDEILTDLTKVADLKVISRRSVAQFRDTKQSAREIGKALQVSHVLEGTVSKSAGRVHVTAQLIDTRTEAEVWAEKYDREVADIFLIKSDVAQEVVSRLKAELSPGEKEAIEQHPTNDQEAYDLYLRARELFYNRGGKTGRAIAEDSKKATELLEAALARDPQFTLAYCLLAEAFLFLDDVDLTLESWQEKAREAVDAALRVSPNSAEAHLARARYLTAVENEAAAEKDLAVAAAGLPGRFDVFHLRAIVEEVRGQWKDALRDSERAAELDPRNVEAVFGLAHLYVVLRRYQNAERLADHMIAVMPKESVPIGFWKLKSNIALAHGDTKAAMVVLDSYPRRQVEPYRVNELIANLFLIERNYPKAEEGLQAILDPEKGKTGLKPGEAGTGSVARGMAYEKLGRIARFRGETEKANSYLVAARQNFEQVLPKMQGRDRWGEAHAAAYIAEIDAALGHKEQAIGAARKLAEVWSMQRDARIAPDVKIILAIVYMWNGEREAAFRELFEVARHPTSPSLYPMCPGLSAGELKLNPVWDELRNDPRFAAIVEEASKPVKID